MILAQKPPTLKLGFKEEKFDDWRDFFEALHNWGYNTDFTYNEDSTTKLDKFVANFLLSYFLDVNLPLEATRTNDFYEDFSKKELKEMFNVLKQFGVVEQLPVKFIYKLQRKKIPGKTK